VSILPKRTTRLLAALGFSLACAGVARAAPLASLDLSGPFATRSTWRFTTSQGPDIPDPAGEEGKVAGVVGLCLSKDGGATCDPATGKALLSPDGPDMFDEPHMLKTVRIVHPSADRPLLLLQIGSLRSGDGGQRIATQLFAYDRRADTFHEVYRWVTGHNNNQEVRYVDTGSLAGAVIAAEPTDDAPFGFWITIDRLAPTGRYAQVLRYRSATRYGDGNPLAVIDSEMPSIERRLGLWHAGQRLPAPAGACPQPHLLRGELWCR